MIGPLVAMATGALAMWTIAQEAISRPELVAWGGVAALPLVVGVVEVLKRAGLPQRWAGLAALILGIAGGLVYGDIAGLGPILSLPQGLLVGLAASGAWSTTKSAGLSR